MNDNDNFNEMGVNMLKKRKFLIILIVIMSGISFSFVNPDDTNEMFGKNNDENESIATYLDGVYSSILPKKNEGYEIEKITCIPDSNISWNSDSWSISFSNGNGNTKCNIYFKFKTIQEFDFTNEEQSLIISKDGLYKLETWGAQGGNSVAAGAKKETGGYGGYSDGYVFLKKGDILYINVAGKGKNGFLNVNDSLGGYNGGGISHWDKNDDEASGGGGGATHIAKVSGLLSTLENNKDSILIVAGGGGGSWINMGGSGGGYMGNGASHSDNQSSIGGTQESGYLFGLGAPGVDLTAAPGGGGGGGYYGGTGGASDSVPGGGGSGYIGNSLLSNKNMYCYNCTESSDEITRTLSTTCNEETPTSYCAKKGNGYARITYMGNVSIEYYQNDNKIDNVPNKDNYIFTNAECTGNSNIVWDNNNWSYNINSYQENDVCKIFFVSRPMYEFDFTGTEQTLVVPKTGIYKLETWGAAGGSASSNLLGGSGGYSAGVISLSKNDVLYINIGGGGNCSTELSVVGGYNGGGAAKSRSSSYTMCSGGGATSITKSSGLLSSFSSSIDKILMVAGGGGGSSKYSNNSSSGGSGGGINGVVPTNACTDCGTRTGGSQTAGGKDRGSTGTFGQGGGSTSSATNGGGGGYYGGGGDSYEWGATGGSGYIGNSLLKNKSMYCYNCTESSEESTKTITTTCNEETPTENCAKKGNGYVKITFIEEN